MHRFSASTEESEVTCYFLDFHDTRDEPRKTQNLEMERLVLGQAAQSESVKALS